MSELVKATMTSEDMKGAIGDVINALFGEVPGEYIETLQEVWDALPCPSGEPSVLALCPNCSGQKTVQRPPWVAGDQPTWVGTGVPLYPCPTCDAKGFIILPAEEGRHE